MILTGENASALRETSPIVTVSTTDLTLSALWSKLKFMNEKPSNLPCDLCQNHELYFVHGGHTLPTHLNKAGERDWQ